MASIVRYDTKNSGPRWRVFDRIDGRLVGPIFVDGAGAADFKARVERIGMEAALAERERRLGTATTDRTPTVADALYEHVDALSGITEGTRSRYTKIADHFAESWLGPMPVTMVGEDTIAEWVRQQKVAAKTVRNRHGLLYAAFKRQVRKGTIRGNPCDVTRIGETERGEMVILNRDELDAILEHLQPHWQPLVRTLAHSGLRFGEATALQVRDLDLDAKPPRLRVARSWKDTGGHGAELGAPKTKKGRRTVYLPMSMVPMLRPLTAGKLRTALVFTNTRGQPIRQNSFHEIWTKALDRSGLEKRPRIHDLRHTYAAGLIARNVPALYLQRQLGHESMKTTYDTYGHLGEDAPWVIAQAAELEMTPIWPELAAQVSSQAGLSQAYPELEA